jgi:hypothetical protein
MEQRLDRYVDITKKFGSVPTFPITAVTLRRHPDIIRKLSRRGVEFAVHGYVHTDYRSQSLERQSRHFIKAMAIFRNCGIPFTGFRAPYLRANGETLEAVKRFSFAYDSSDTILWDVVDSTKCGKQAWQVYQKALCLYEPKNAREYLSLPRATNGIVRIPVSIPEDEAMVDRLGITDEKAITEIWGAIFRETYARGELFTLALHHERIEQCAGALESVFQQATELDPPVWITNLGEIAEWWGERGKFTFEVKPESDGRYAVKANCSERATLLLRNCGVDKPTADWSGRYKTIEAREFVVESPRPPFIGVAPDSSPDAIAFLRHEGFIVEESDQPADYGIYLADLTDFQEGDAKPLVEALEASNHPLVRYWRWPNKARSALAATGDIDSMTLADFLLRVFEV